jgi:predicted SAM-dependent methyltransferase
MKEYSIKQILKLLTQRIIPKKYHSKLKALVYIGNKFECPFCGGHFRKLLPSGLNLSVLNNMKVVSGGYRLNSLCPQCHSSDRERMVYLFIRNKTTLFQKTQKQLRILHVAPENNLQQVLTSYAHFDYLCADLSPSFTTVKIDITNIQYEDNSFDVIICCHVFEHIQNDLRAMSELYRVLKHGGWAILQVPISLSLKNTYEDPMIMTPDDRKKAFGQSDHVRIYAQDYKDRLEKVGFSVGIFNLASEYGTSFADKYGLLKNENIYFCNK